MASRFGVISREAVFATFFVVLSVSPQVAQAKPFAPDPKDVCRAVPGDLSAVRTIAKLFDVNSISDWGLDPSGGQVTPELRADALENLRCVGSSCSKDTAQKLQTAAGQLKSFIVSVAEGREKQFELVSSLTADDQARLIHAFDTNRLHIVCHVVANDVPAVVSSAGSEDKTPLQRIEVRSAIDDLSIDSSSSWFAGLTPATIGFDDNDIAHTRTFSATAVLGYDVGQASYGDGFLDFYPFVAYSLKSVNATPTPPGNIDNASAGVLARAFFHAGFYQELRLYPEYTRSLYDGAQTLTFSATYLPEPGTIPFLAAPHAIGDDFIFLGFVPSANLSYVDVLSAGRNLALATHPGYLRLVPGLDAHLYGAAGTFFSRFSAGASYRFYHAIDGNTGDFTNFQASLNFVPFPNPDPSATQNITITLKYVIGQDPTSLVHQNDITIGVGVKY